MTEVDRRPELNALLGELAKFRSVTLKGEPSGRALAKAGGVSPTTVGKWLRGAAFPQQIDSLIKIVEAVRAYARRPGPARRQAEAAAATGLWDLQQWREAHFAEAQRRASITSRAVQAAQAHAVLEEARPGTPLDQVLDPFVLEVHRPIAVNGPITGMLPTYVRREHDERLDQVVTRVLDGTSAMAVLVAGSSAGKTRACWEALKPLRQAGGWRLWHPFNPTRPEAALQELERVGPRTVVWLNESQDYLAADAGGRVAAKLRTLLHDQIRGPVLVLGTLWREHHADLTRRSDSQVTQVLEGTVIEVPETFTGPDLDALARSASDDARLAAAMEHAEDGHITQYLAGAPELLARFVTAPSAAKAVIMAAMDARRLGHRNALSLALLETAAPAYLTDAQWDQMGEDWLEQALAYTSRPCKGARGPVTRIRHGRSRHRIATPPAAEESTGGPVYRLADFLEQHGLRHRADQIPPLGFWTAAAAHAHPGDLNALGNAAWARGLYRNSVQLHKNATAHGDPYAAGALVDHLHVLHPADRRPAHWAAAHTVVDNPNAVAALLDQLRTVGADEQVTMLAERAAAHTTDNPNVVTEMDDRPIDEVIDEVLDQAQAEEALLSQLLWDGADEQVTILLNRTLWVGVDGQPPKQLPPHLAKRYPPTHAIFGKRDIVGWLLDRLLEAEADEQVTRLVERLPAAGLFDQFMKIADHRERFWFGLEPDITAAAPWGWEDLE